MVQILRPETYWYWPRKNNISGKDTRPVCSNCLGVDHGRLSLDVFGSGGWHLVTHIRGRRGKRHRCNTCSSSSWKTEAVWVYQQGARRVVQWRKWRSPDPLQSQSHSCEEGKWLPLVRSMAKLLLPIFPFNLPKLTKIWSNCLYSNNSPIPGTVSLDWEAMDAHCLLTMPSVVAPVSAHLCSGRTNQVYAASSRHPTHCQPNPSGSSLHCCTCSVIELTAFASPGSRCTLSYGQEPSIKRSNQLFVSWSQLH